MGLPIHARAAALVVALSTTASIIVTLAEMGHPPLDGRGVLELLFLPIPAPRQGLALVTGETPRDTAVLQMLEP